MIPYCQHSIRDADREAVGRVLDSSRLTQGPMVPAFEAALCAETAAEHAIAVSSGTSALQIALSALGVGPGDEVIVPSLTFVATANAVVACGATPVFADVSPATLALDPASVERRLGPRCRGAIVVHFAGHVADVPALEAVLGPDRFLVEDACHALGAEAAGRRVGAAATAACFSFHPAKHVTTGEGGAVTTDDEALAERCRVLRSHGVVHAPEARLGLGLPAALVAEERGGWVYEQHALSANHRLADLGAALGTSQLARLDELLDVRRRLARRYDEAFQRNERVCSLPERPGTRSAWHLYPVQVDPERIRGGRAAVHRALHERGVGVQVHYIPVHLQPFYRQGYGTAWGDLPETEAAYLRLLSLPLFPGLSSDDQAYVIACLDDVLQELAR